MRRLEQYIFSDNKSFNLEDFNVVMKGFSGAHMSTLQYFAQSHSEDLLGSSVILQIGGNDLNSPHVEPVQLAREIVNFSRNLVNNKGMISVTVLKLFYRVQSVSSRFVLTQHYNLLVDQVNKELEFLCEFFPKLRFLTHKRM